jgi:hypothetical protein
MVQVILFIAAAYAIVGLTVAAAFIAAGVSRVDPTARGASPWFRLVMLPGLAALWPVVIAWWVRAAGRGHGGAGDATH